MIHTTHNDQMGTHRPRQGKPRRGGSDALAPVRLNSIGEQGHLPVNWRGFGPVLFQFNPHVAPSSSTLRRRQQLERTPRRSLLPVYCGGTPSRRWRGRGFALSAVMRLRLIHCVHQSAFQGLADVSPVVIKHTVRPFASEARARRRPVSWKPHPARTAE